MKRDMKELEDQAAASARSAQAEKQHSLQLEKDLKILAAELEQVKKESEILVLVLILIATTLSFISFLLVLGFICGCMLISTCHDLTNCKGKYPDSSSPSYDLASNSRDCSCNFSPYWI